MPIRGGALSSEWKWDDFDDTQRTAEGETTHEAMWANFEYFLKAVIPVAEEAGVYLACHPGLFQKEIGLEESRGSECLCPYVDL